MRDEENVAVGHSVNRFLLLRWGPTPSACQPSLFARAAV
jgi:hypothetical protein